MFALFPFFRKPNPSASGAKAYSWALMQAKDLFPSRYNSPSATDDERRQKFEPIALFAVFAIESLQQNGEHAEARGLVEAMMENFDDALRESGVGDLAVAKKIRTLAGAFNGRLQTYQPALQNEDWDELEAALTRNHFGLASEVKCAVSHLKGLKKKKDFPFLTHKQAA